MGENQSRGLSYENSSDQAGSPFATEYGRRISESSADHKSIFFAQSVAGSAAPSTFQSAHELRLHKEAHSPVANRLQIRLEVRSSSDAC